MRLPNTKPPLLGLYINQQNQPYIHFPRKVSKGFGLSLSWILADVHHVMTSTICKKHKGKKHAKYSVIKMIANGWSHHRPRLSPNMSWPFRPWDVQRPKVFEPILNGLSLGLSEVLSRWPTLGQQIRQQMKQTFYRWDGLGAPSLPICLIWEFSLGLITKWAAFKCLDIH